MTKSLRFNVAILCSVLAVTVTAQAPGSFAYRADLGEVSKSGFYRVLLRPGIVAKCKSSNLEDIRLTDNTGKYIPYIIKNDLAPDTIGRYFALPAPMLHIGAGNGKRAYLVAEFKENYQVNRLDFAIDWPAYYHRPVMVYNNKQPRRVLARFVLDPKNNSFQLTSTRAEALSIQITNDDNPPLKIRSVSAFQSMEQLVAYFEKNKHYSLLFGSNSTRRVSYDLRYFEDSFPGKLATLGVSEPVANAAFGKDLHRADGWLWVVIIMVLILLCVFTLRLAREVRSKDDELAA